MNIINFITGSTSEQISQNSKDANRCFAIRNALQLDKELFSHLKAIFETVCLQKPDFGPFNFLFNYCVKDLKIFYELYRSNGFEAKIKSAEKAPKNIFELIRLHFNFVVSIDFYLLNINRVLGEIAAVFNKNRAFRNLLFKLYTEKGFDFFEAIKFPLIFIKEYPRVVYETIPFAPSAEMVKIVEITTRRINSVFDTAEKTLKGFRLNYILSDCFTVQDSLEHDHVCLKECFNLRAKVGRKYRTQFPVDKLYRLTRSFAGQFYKNSIGMLMLAPSKHVESFSESLYRSIQVLTDKRINQTIDSMTEEKKKKYSEEMGPTLTAMIRKGPSLFLDEAKNEFDEKKFNRYTEWRDFLMAQSARRHSRYQAESLRNYDKLFRSILQYNDIERKGEFSEERSSLDEDLEDIEKSKKDKILANPEKYIKSGKNPRHRRIHLHRLQYRILARRIAKEPPSTAEEPFHPIDEKLFKLSPSSGLLVRSYSAQERLGINVRRAPRSKYDFNGHFYNKMVEAEKDKTDLPATDFEYETDVLWRVEDNFNNALSKTHHVDALRRREIAWEMQKEYDQEKGSELFREWFGRENSEEYFAESAKSRQRRKIATSEATARSVRLLKESRRVLAENESIQNASRKNSLAENIKNLNENFIKNSAKNKIKNGIKNNIKNSENFKNNVKNGIKNDLKLNYVKNGENGENDENDEKGEIYENDEKYSGDPPFEMSESAFFVWICRKCDLMSYDEMKICSFCNINQTESFTEKFGVNMENIFDFLEKTKTSLKTLSQKLITSTNATKSLQSKISAHSSQIAKNAAQSSQKHAELSGKIISLKESNLELSTAKDALVVQLEKQRAAKDALQEKLTQAESARALAEDREEKTRQQMVSFEAENARLSRYKKSVEVKIDQSTKDLGRAVASLEKATASEAEMRQKLVDCEAFSGKVEKENAELRRAAKENLDKAKIFEGEKKEWIGKIKAKTEEIEKLKRLKNEGESEIGKLRERSNFLEGENKGLKGEIERIKGDFEGVIEGQKREILVLVEELKGLKEKLHKTETNSAEIKDRFMTFEKKIAGTEAVAKSVIRSASEISAQCEKFKSDFERRKTINFWSDKKVKYHFLLTLLTICIIFVIDKKELKFRAAFIRLFLKPSVWMKAPT